jgi:hypothetical protein
MFPAETNLQIGLIDSAVDSSHEGILQLDHPAETPLTLKLA